MARGARRERGASAALYCMFTELYSTVCSRSAWMERDDCVHDECGSPTGPLRARSRAASPAWLWSGEFWRLSLCCLEERLLSNNRTIARFTARLRWRSCGRRQCAVTTPTRALRAFSFRSGSGVSSRDLGRDSASGTCAVCSVRTVLILLHMGLSLLRTRTSHTSSQSPD